MHLVREGYTWDPEIEMRRRNWLSCVTDKERRYISRAPHDWLDWTDAHLLAAMLAAPVDRRQDQPGDA